MRKTRLHDILMTYIGTYSDYRADPGTTPKPGPGLPPHAQNHTFRETPPPPLTRNHALRAHRLLAGPAIARTEVLGGRPWDQDGIGASATPPSIGHGTRWRGKALIADRGDTDD